MNLVTGDWIPVVFQDGAHRLVSLRTAFTETDTIRDLHARPHERIALMRLLVCVAQAALKGPETRDKWEELGSRLAGIQEAALRYLNHWQGSFELLGPGPRFLQATGSGKPGVLHASKLQFIDKATATIFDQAVQPDQTHNPSWLALNLVTYQSFAAGGTVGGAEKIEGRMQPAKGTNAPCRDQSAFHLFVLGENLLNSVWLNMASKDEIQRFSVLAWDSPIWERGGIGIEEIRSSQNAVDGQRGYFSRLAPLSRAIWLDEAGRTMQLSNGLNYANFEKQEVWETTASCVTDKEQNKKVLISAKAERSVTQPWRVLHGLVMKRSASKLGGALSLARTSEPAARSIWVGALAASRADITDTVESSFTPQVGQWSDAQLALYGDGVEYAKGWEAGLFDCLRSFSQQLQFNHEHGKRFAREATLSLWSHLQRSLPELFAIVTARLEEHADWFGERLSLLWHKTPWGDACREAAEAAFDRACPHGTPRQMQAYSLARRWLRPPQPSQPKDKRKSTAKAVAKT